MHCWGKGKCSLFGASTLLCIQDIDWLIDWLIEERSDTRDRWMFSKFKLWVLCERCYIWSFLVEEWFCGRLSFVFGQTWFIYFDLSRHRQSFAFLMWMLSSLSVCLSVVTLWGSAAFRRCENIKVLIFCHRFASVVKWRKRRPARIFKIITVVIQSFSQSGQSWHSGSQRPATPNPYVLHLPPTSIIGIVHVLTVIFHLLL